MLLVIEIVAMVVDTFFAGMASRQAAVVQCYWQGYSVSTQAAVVAITAKYSGSYLISFQYLGIPLH